MKAAFIVVMVVLGLLVAALVISLMGGCAYDSYFNPDGTRTNPLATHQWQYGTNKPPGVELPAPKGQ